MKAHLWWKLGAVIMLGLAAGRIGQLLGRADAAAALPTRPAMHCDVAQNCVILRRDGTRCTNWQHGRHAADAPGWHCQ